MSKISKENINEIITFIVMAGIVLGFLYCISIRVGKSNEIYRAKHRDEIYASEYVLYREYLIGKSTMYLRGKLDNNYGTVELLNKKDSSIYKIVPIMDVDAIKY